MDYEKGSPAWDISMILTLHASRAHGDPTHCARVESLLVSRGLEGRIRLDRALAVKCTCGKGDSPAEQTTYTMEAANAVRVTAAEA